MNITRGKIMSAKKVVIYGPEGIGKSTLAAQFPAPLFIDTEGSTKEMDVARLDKPESWEFLLAELDFVRTQRPCKTLVIDTIDWAEQLCIKNVCDKAGKKGIEDFGYGKGYVYEKEAFQRLLTALDGVIYAGINVVLTAHAALRKFEQPDEMGSYDRWEMKLGAKTTNLISPLIKEWADMVLFANYKILSVAADDKGKKHKAQGGKRIMYTSHHACWDAKNRYGLPEEIPMDYSAIAHIFAAVPTTAPADMTNVSTTPPPVSTTATVNTTSAPNMPPPAPVNTAPATSQAPEPSYIQDIPPDELPVQQTQQAATVQTAPAPSPTPPRAPGLPKALVDLMTANHVTEEEIRQAIAIRRYYPEDMPITAYDPAFIDGVLIGAWNQVLEVIEKQVRYPF
ncbi:MAG: AAA family ATPase [Ruminiclostridium sp.]|nr:AAA family ATPase [Ruminiclostridium sp.]